MNETKDSNSKLIDIPNDWYSVLRPMIESPAFATLGKHIAQERRTKTIYPKKEDTFRAFRLTPLSKVVAVMIGMDPYPNTNQGLPVANGLAFDTDVPSYIPPSLRQIYNGVKECLYKDELTFPVDMNLKSWAEQGVFLINAALTVEANRPGSHMQLWNEFTINLIKTIDEHTHGVFFCFWGKDAQKFKHLVSDHNFVLIASHPVSASYSGKNWECDHFKAINDYLLKYNNYEIQWIKTA